LWSLWTLFTLMRKIWTTTVMTFLLTMMTKLTILLLDNDDANIVVIITRSAAYLCKAMILLKHFSLLMLPYDGVPPVEAAIVQLSRK